MPARVAQRTETVPVDEWCPVCIECLWIDQPTTIEALANQVAYDHNRERHDGAGVVPQLSDFDALLPDLAHFQKMFRVGAVSAVVCLLLTVLNAVTVDHAAFRAFTVGLIGTCAVLNAMMAGKWARRIEAATIG